MNKERIKLSEGKYVYLSEDIKPLEKQLLRDFLDRVDVKYIDRDRCMIVNFSREYLTNLIDKKDGKFSAPNDLDLIYEVVEANIEIQSDDGIKSITIAERLYYGDEVGLHMLSSRKFTELLEEHPNLTSVVKTLIG